MEKINEIKFNKVVFDINENHLNEKYKLYLIENNKDNILTVVSKNKGFMESVYSCYFVSYHQMYVLTKEDISKYILSFSNTSIQRQDIFKTDKTVLLNLILYLETTIRSSTEPICNLDGQCYLFMEAIGRSIAEPDKIKTLQLRFVNGDFGTCLKSDLVTFTKLSKFGKKRLETDKKIHTKPRYAFNMTRTLSRTNETNDDKVYIKKVINPNNKNTITECKINDKDFRSCRVYSYYLVYKLLNPENNNFMLHFDFIGDDFEPIKKITEKNIQEIMPTLSPYKLCIINATDKKGIEKGIVSYLEQHKKDFSITSISVINENINSLKEIEQEYNTRYIIIIPNKEKENDILHHNANIIKQCITTESLSKELKTLIPNVINQLQIKQDIKNKKVSILDTNKLLKETVITSIIICYTKNAQTDKYVATSFNSITIDSNGFITNQLDKQDISQIEYTYPEIYNELIEHEKTDKEREYFLIVNGETFRFDKTNYKTIPNITKLYNRMSVDKNFSQTASYFLTLLENTIKNKEPEHIVALDEINNLFYDKNEYITVKEFIGILENHSNKKMETYKQFKKDNPKLNKPKEKTMFDKFICYLDDNDIYYHNNIRKAGNFLNEILSCYAKSCYKIQEDTFYYFMQARNPKDNPGKSGIQNAPAIYSIKNINNSAITNEQKDIFLWLLCVTFVKFNCYSTKPFLFKYLDEIALNEKEKL